MTLPVEELEALIADLRWEHFESILTGNILVQNKMFCMRVGEHLGRPVQVIICDGQFVRMRSAEHYQQMTLHKLDPERLSESLYMDGSSVQWRPNTFDPRKMMVGIGAQSRAGIATPGQSYTTSAQAQSAMMQAQIANNTLKLENLKIEEEINSRLKSAKKPYKMMPWSKIRWRIE
jgi:hypothetical protein